MINATPYQMHREALRKRARSVSVEQARASSDASVADTIATASDPAPPPPVAMSTDSVDYELPVVPGYPQPPELTRELCTTISNDPDLKLTEVSSARRVIDSYSPGGNCAFRYVEGVNRSERSAGDILNAVQISCRGRSAILFLDVARPGQVDNGYSKRVMPSIVSVIERYSLGTISSCLPFVNHNHSSGCDTFWCFNPNWGHLNSVMACVPGTAANKEGRW